jgi:uncharacterized protein (DUF427 family)
MEPMDAAHDHETAICAPNVDDMSDARPVLEPTAEHPITIEPTGARVVVKVGDTVVADSTDALTLQEAKYPPVYYLPLDDVTDQALLQPSDHQSYCPFKGDAGYYSVDLPDGENLVWYYTEPYPAVAEIAGRIAFYGNRAEITVG